MNPSITVSELRHQLPAQPQLIGVRSPSEFASGHIPTAINIPMDEIEARVHDLHANVPLILICQAGTRARVTAALLEPCQRQIAILEGGTSAWLAAGLPIVTSVKTRWSLERQVRLGAGLIVLTGIILALAINSYWLFLSAFAGATDICLMGILLEKMPWNARSHCRIIHSNAEPEKAGQ